MKTKNETDLVKVETEFDLQKWLAKTRQVVSEYEVLGEPFINIRPRIICFDGFSFSVQASCMNYCHPRTSEEGVHYRDVEVGYLSEEEPLLNSHIENYDNKSPTDCIYPYTPSKVVEMVVDKHGGFKENEGPIDVEFVEVEKETRLIEEGG